MASYREKWFAANRPAWNGLYRCTCCGQYFPKTEIDIDHIVPRNKGGTDELWNLQPMCRHCNRSKSDDTTKTGRDLAFNVAKNLMQGNSIDNVGELAASVLTKNATNTIQEALGIKKKRRHKNNIYKR